MSTHANRVKMTVTSVASSGTGDITLNAASTGFRSFATAYSNANATVDILITEGTAWEIARNCTYTHSGTTVSRGTLENSSTGSAVVFTADAVVSVIATAAFGNNAALNHVTGGDADTTMAVGNMYVTDMSAWATADRTYTLPASAAVGDRIGIMVTAGDASHELIIKPNTGDTINGGSAAAEWSRLFITGEVVILRCVTADSAWVVEYDGRISQQGLLRLSTASTGETANEWTQPTAKSGAWTADVNIGSVCDTANDRIIPRRLGQYVINAGYVANTTSNADVSHACGVWVNSVAGTLITNSLYYVSVFAGLGFASCAVSSYPLPSLGDGITYSYFSSQGSRGAIASSSAASQRCFLAVTEILP